MCCLDYADGYTESGGNLEVMSRKYRTKHPKPKKRKTENALKKQKKQKKKNAKSQGEKEPEIASKSTKTETKHVGGKIITTITTTYKYRDGSERTETSVTTKSS